MKIYALHRYAHEWFPDVEFYHDVMFHGEAIVPPERKGIASHTIDEVDIEPMRLVVNGHQLSEIFLPISSCNLVVSERVKRQLEAFRTGFMFMKVEFAKVYNLAWPRTSVAASELPPIINYYRERGREMSILSACPHDPLTAESLPAYFEIVTQNHYRLLEMYSPTHNFFSECYPGEPTESDLLPVSEALFRTYPIVDAAYPIIRDDVLEVLSPYLNRRSFGIKEFAFAD